ncbi:hypothetical protein SAMN04488074_11622 [Lentzea albidocapillata subsp. violacea]|uniref:Uncharacterized protein n=1 Tax=Lentzea albidocapillata subsp. violacea TaxID=128104 RepID=A0A1G9Q498_9PSEU|nr:hypothetical protein [Lentzea albidocapillata]SDM05806.1 hypothetical protein SAMN04488074_11622 [Lentzea albidocapillata subsp. violacea]
MTLTEKYIDPRMRGLLSVKLTDRSDADIDVQLEECLKFLEIVSAGEGSSFIPLSKEVDEIWHELIVETGSYRRLCDALPGRRFINHESIGLEDYAGRSTKAVVSAQFLEWIPKYISRYGRFTEEVANHWTICQFLRTELGMSLDEINEMGLRELGKPTLTAS